MGGKSGGTPKMQVTRYHLSIHAGICHGPVDAIKALWVGEKKAWEGNITENGVLRVIKENLFGGVKKEGGVSGHIDVMLGGPDQLPTTPLVERLKRPRADVPGFRGITSLLFRGRGNTNPDFDATGLFGMAWIFTILLKYRGFYWGTQPYLKPVWVTVQRIPAKSLLPGTAAIPRQTPGADYLAFYEGFANGLSGFAAWQPDNANDPADPFSYFEIVDGYLGDGLRVGPIPANAYLTHPSVYRTLPVEAPLERVECRMRLDSIETDDTGWLVLRDPDGGSVFNISVCRDSAIDALRRPAVSFIYESGMQGIPMGSGPLTVGVWYSFVAEYDPARGSFSARIAEADSDAEFASVEVEISSRPPIKTVHIETDASASRKAGSSTWDEIQITVGTPVLDANPAHVVYECLTDTDWGMGADPAGIDTASFQAASQTLYDEGFGLFLQWQAQSSIEDFINDVLDHVRGAIYPDPRTGKIAMTLLRDDLDLPNLKTITPDNARLNNFSRKGWGETTNEIVVTWTRPETEQEETVVAQDLANIVTQGGIVSSSKNYHGIRTRELAAKVAERDLREESAPLSSCEAEVNREFWDITPFDGVKVDWPEFGLDGLVMRVMKVDYGDSQNATVKLSLVEDVFSLATATYVEPAAGEWVDPAAPPVPVTQARLMPPPAYVVSNNGIDPVDVIDPSTGAVPLATNPTGDDAARYDTLREVSTPSGGTTFQDSGGTRDFAARGTLTAALPPAVTSTGVLLDALVGVPPAVDDLLLVGDDLLPNEALELALVTAVDEETGALTLLRGVLDTVPRDWDAGTLAQVTPLDLWRPLPVELTASQSVTLKFLTRTAYGMLEEYEATEFTATAAQRPALPTRAANLRAFGQLFPDPDVYPEYPVTVTWSHRNRLLEDAAMLAWDGASLVAETGTDYRVLVEGVQADGTVDGTVADTTTTGESYVLDEATIQAAALTSSPFMRVTVTARRDSLGNWQSPSIRFRGLLRPPEILQVQEWLFTPEILAVEPS